MRYVEVQALRKPYTKNSSDRKIRENLRPWRRWTVKRKRSPRDTILSDFAPYSGDFEVKNFGEFCRNFHRAGQLEIACYYTLKFEKKSYFGRSPSRSLNTLKFEKKSFVDFEGPLKKALKNPSLSKRKKNPSKMKKNPFSAPFKKRQ